MDDTSYWPIAECHNKKNNNSVFPRMNEPLVIFVCYYGYILLYYNISKDNYKRFTYKIDIDTNNKELHSNNNVRIIIRIRHHKATINIPEQSSIKITLIA